VSGRASLSVEDLDVAYANGVLAMRSASFALEGGTICALAGPNGAGKSTLFKAIMGVLKPLRGKVNINGLPVTQALKQMLLAYVPQAEEIDWNFPVLVEDVVMMGRYGHMNIFRMPRAEDRKAVDAALERVELSDLRRRQIGELSGGQKRRMFLARALAQASPVILLDEPFTGVDVKTEEQIIALLQELRGEGRLMLVSTHNLGSIPDYCDQVILVNKRVVAAGPTAQTFNEANLREAFGGVLRHFRLEGSELHEDSDPRGITVLTDDERPAVFYRERKP
jgi:manganese/iron transport system ATP-binding protein